MKELRVLNDEELNKAWDSAFDTPVDFDHKPTAGELFTIRLKAVAQTQFQHDIGAIYEWGNETCPHDLGEGTQCFKHACDLCWQSLQQLVKEKKDGNSRK